MELTADCSRCVGLCCVALAFDRSEHFAYDKPAGVPCIHLEKNVCKIHEHLEEAGFSGCARYDCGGAGQRVTAMFDGDEGDEREAMFDAFHRMRDVHELAIVLETAAALPLTDEQASTRRSLACALDGEGSLVHLERTAEGARTFLKTLSACFKRR